MKEKLIGYVSVDSGQVMIIDPTYVELFQEKAIVTKNPFENDPSPHTKKFTKGYLAACEQSLSKEQAGQIKAGTTVNTSFDIAVASSSGIGDGQYPVLAKYSKDGCVAQLTITFIKDIPEDESQKPIAQLTGTNGNIFALLGTAARYLNEQGKRNIAEKLSKEIVYNCKTYDEALVKITETLEAEGFSVQ